MTDRSAAGIPGQPPAGGASASRPGAAEPTCAAPPASIRPLRSEDLPHVTAIEQASFTTPWSEQTFSNLLGRSNACLLAAVNADERVLGYAAVWFAGGAGELGNLAVELTDRRSGVGSMLVNAILEEGRARGARQIFLEVRETNLNAQSLYERHGFEVVGRRKNYYAGPVEDALVMRRLLIR